jgi:hypothetical protein
MSTYVAG